MGGRQLGQRKKKTTRLILEQLEDRTVPSPLSGTGINITATEGAPFTGTVATFTDTNTAAAAGDFTATIRWGDGSSSAGTITGSAGSFTVQGSHTYAQEGSSAVSVSINGLAGVSTDLRTVSAGTVSTFVPPDLASPGALTFDSSGNLYVANYGGGSPGNEVLRVGANGIGSLFLHDNGQLDYPRALATDSSGNLYLANSNGVFKISPDGSVSSFPGGGNQPDALTFAPNGDLYIAYLGNNTVGKVTPGGVVSTFASVTLGGQDAMAFDSSGNLFVADYLSSTVSKITADGVVSTFLSSGLSYPVGLAFDSGGNLYVANGGSNGYGPIIKVTPNGTVSTLTSLADMNGLAIDSSNNLYVTDEIHNMVQEISPSGVVSTFVGRELYDPYGMVFDSSGNIYVANAISGINGPSTCPVSKITPGGVVSTFASGFSQPSGLAMDGSGNLYVSDYPKNTISKVTPDGTVSTFVSSGLNGPGALAVDGGGNLFVAEGNNTVSEVSPSGTVTTFVSSGVNGPTALAFDGIGNLYIANFYSGTVEEVAPDGTVSTFASGIRTPDALAFDGIGNLYVSVANSVLQVSPDGAVSAFLDGVNTEDLGFDRNGNLYFAGVGNALEKVIVNATTTPTVTSTANIADAALSAAGITFNAAPGAPVNNVRVATFTEANPAAAATDFSATVAWGDGDSTAGVSIIADPQVAGQFDVLASKSHAYAGQGSVPVSVTINDAGGSTTTASSAAQLSVPTVTNLVSDHPNGSVYGQAVTFTATVAAGSGTPAGTVQFQIDGANAGPAVALNAGSATFQTAALAAGTHTIAAVYNGSGSFLSSSASLTQTVLSAQGEITAISNQVTTLVNTAVLNHGDGNALTAKLNAATGSLNAGNTTAGVNQLNAFINQVNAFQKSGKLTTAQAQALVSSANLAITAAQGSGARLLNDSSSGTSATGDAQPVTDAGELVSGTLGVCLEDSAGTVTADEQARFDDAITTLNATFCAYGVTLVDVGAADAADAIVQVEIADTSAVGSASDGVLGCTLAGQITLLTGWDWYTGADPSVIGPGQYDFQTIVTHELGHAIGLGHSGDSGSVMYPYLAPGQAHRGVTSQDLSVLESGTGPEPLLAAPWRDTQHVLPPTAAAPTAAEAPSSHLGTDTAANVWAAVLPAGPAPALAAPAGWASVLAGASAQGKLATVNAAASAVAPAGSLVQSWSQGAAGYGVWNAVLAQGPTGNRTGATADVVPIEDTTALQATDPCKDAIPPLRDNAPPASKLPATPESEVAPLGSPLPAPAFPSDPAALDALMEQCTRLQPAGEHREHR
jgi:sugar lactone lactonase YvrE